MSIKTELCGLEQEVFAAPNKSYWCSGERLIHSVKVSESLVVRVYASRWNRFRGVAFNGSRAYSGVVGTDGTISMRATAFDMQGHHTTHKIIEVMQSVGIECEPSQFQTEAGAACYKEPRRRAA